MNTTTKVIEVEGTQHYFLLTPWVSRVFKITSPLALLAAYRDDSISIILEIAFISYKEAVGDNGMPINGQDQVTEKQFFNIYARLQKEDKQDLKETLVANFLDLDPDKTIIGEFELLWENADDEDKMKIKKFVLAPPKKEGKNSTGKKSSLVGQKSNRLPLEG